MDNVLIDPLILTTPAEDAPREVVVAYLDNLNIWLQEALTSPYKWFHSVNATYLLEANGLFPTFGLLRRWQSKYRLDINIGLLSRRLNEFFRDEQLDLKSKLDALILVEAVKESVTVQPASFSRRWLDFLQEEMLPLLTIACACKHAREKLASGLNMATVFLTDAPNREIRVSAIISAYEPELRLDDTRSISQVFPLLFTPNDFPPLTNFVLIWSQGEPRIRYAVERQFRHDWQNHPQAPWEYRVGPHFVASVEERGLDTNETLLGKIIRATAAIIADKAKDITSYKLHPFRESEAADSPQLTRPNDNAKAWRLDLMKEGAGWRLHYWQIPAVGGGSIIELSNVCREKERIIF